MGDRIAVLHRGRVLQTDTPETVYERPATPDVARQLGQPAINLLPVEREDGHWHAAGNIPVLPVAAADDHPPKMLLGIRPEHVQAEGGAHAARVEVVEDTGPEKIILADWGGSRIHLLTPRQAPWRPGDTIYPRIPPARALLWPRPATDAMPS